MATSITDFLIRVKVTGQQLVDKLTKSANDVEKGMDKATTSTNKFNTAAKDLGDTLKGSISSGNAFVDSIGGVISKLGGVTASIGLAATAFIGLGTKAVLAADAIMDIADATGISAGRLLNLQKSILLAGGTAEDFQKVSLKLVQTLGDAEQGNEKVRKSFSDLGISLGNANGDLRSTDELLPEIIQALGNIEDPAVRAKTAVELLGKSAAKIDWSKVTAAKDIFKDAEIEQLAKYKEAIDKLANSISNNLITAFGKLAIAIDTGGFKGALKTFDDWITDTQVQLLKLIGLIKTAEDELNFRVRREQMQKMERPTGAPPGQIPLPAGVEPSRAGGGRGFINPPSAIQEGLPGQLKMTDASIQAMKAAQAQTEAMRQTNSTTEKYANLLNDTIGMQELAGSIARSNLQIDRDRDIKLADINKQIETELANKERDQRLTKALVDELRQQGIEVIRNADANKTAKAEEIVKLQQQKQLLLDIAVVNQQIASDTQLNQVTNQNKLIGLFGDELKLKQGLLQIETERLNAIIASENKLRALGKDATAADINRSKTEIDNAQNVATRKENILRDQLDREKALRENSVLGAQTALEKIARATDPFQVAQNKVTSLFSNMDSAIDNFVETGNLKFGQFARNVIQDILKIELKAAASKLFSSLFGNSGILGSIFGGFFANGGQPPVGKVSVVGEKGPELFIPKTAGTILPNNQLAMAGNRGSVQNTYITNNISALDAKSVAALFADNRKTLLGTVELARKEMPYYNR